MVTANIETITPQIAKKYLEANTQNYRQLNRSRMIAYANEMTAGMWQTNGEPIVFDEDGVLKDGQTRLAAIVYSGISIELMVVRGISKRYGKYRVNIRIKRLGYQFDKTFETLEEAIAAKEQFINGKEYFARYKGVLPLQEAVCT